MAILSREEYLKKLSELVTGTDDDSLKVIEDFTETYDSRNENQEDWKKKYEDLDADWRNRYRQRFFSSTDPETVVEEQREDVQEDGKIKTYDELFEEREG